MWQTTHSSSAHYTNEGYAVADKLTQRPWVRGMCVYFPTTRDIGVLFLYVAAQRNNPKHGSLPFPTREELARKVDSIIENMMGG